MAPEIAFDGNLIAGQVGSKPGFKDLCQDLPALPCPGPVLHLTFSVESLSLLAKTQP